MATPPGYARISHQLTLSGFPRSAFITYAVHPAGGTPPAIATDCANAMIAAGSLMTQIDTSVQLTGTRASVGTDGAEDLIGISTLSGAGSVAGSALPPQCAMLLHKRTTRGGRRGRGRMFIPWCRGEVDVDEAGLWSATQVSNVQNACNVFMTQLSTRVGGMWLLHGPSEEGTAHPTSAGPPNEVFALDVDPLISTQRRRLGRR